MSTVACTCMGCFQPPARQVVSVWCSWQLAFLPPGRPHLPPHPLPTPPKKTSLKRTSSFFLSVCFYFNIPIFMKTAFLLIDKLLVIQRFFSWLLEPVCNANKNICRLHPSSRMWTAWSEGMDQHQSRGRCPSVHGLKMFPADSCIVQDFVSGGGNGSNALEKCLLFWCLRLLQLFKNLKLSGWTSRRLRKNLCSC